MEIESRGPTLADLHRQPKHVTDEFLIDLNKTAGFLPDQVELFDLLPRRTYYGKKYQRQVNPPEGWEKYLNTLNKFGSKSSLSHAINCAIKAGYRTLEDVRITSYDQMIEPSTDTRHFHIRLNPIPAVILKRGFAKIEPA